MEVGRELHRRRRRRLASPSPRPPRRLLSRCRGPRSIQLEELQRRRLWLLFVPWPWPQLVKQKEKQSQERRQFDRIENSNETRRKVRLTLLQLLRVVQIPFAS